MPLILGLGAKFLSLYELYAIAYKLSSGTERIKAKSTFFYGRTSRCGDLPNPAQEEKKVVGCPRILGSGDYHESGTPPEYRYGATVLSSCAEGCGE